MSSVLPDEAKRFRESRFGRDVRGAGQRVGPDEKERHGCSTDFPARSFLVSLLRRFDDVELVGEAANSTEAIELL